MRRPEYWVHPEMSGQGQEPATSKNSQPDFFPDSRLIEIALEAGRIGIWSWDLATNRVTWSSNLEGIHRLPGGSFDGTLEFVRNDVHPDDRAQVLAAIEEALRTGTPRRILYRLPPRADQEEHWMESLAIV